MHALTQLAEFVSGHPKGALPSETREAISLLLLDLMGATAAGLHSRLAASARQAASDVYGSGVAQVWLTDLKLSVVGAAMANSAAASALDIDDGHRGAAGHAGAGVIPAALAVGQSINASDAEMLDAIALGYDVALRVATSRPTNTIETYASGRWVSYGAAAAAGRLLRLDAEEMAHALAIAGSEGPIVFPTGSSKFQGSTVKEGIPPAVVAGITGAYRARAGATGPVDLLNNEDRYDPKILLGQLGEVWELQKCYLKPYACCRYMHAAIDAILKMRQDGRHIHRLRIETFPQGLRLANERTPSTLEGGQYSFYFSCALAALRGQEALQPVDPDSLKDIEVLGLANRIELETSIDFATAFPVRTPARVLIDQGDGEKELVIDHPLGDVANPMSWDQVAHKFKNIGRVSLSTQSQDSIISAISQLNEAGFTPLLSALSKSQDNNLQ
ncbi:MULTISPECIES: MmgE/PrpD family protein [Brucella]|jgi:2-methylcitrate dehydratase PrpD|uniref:MmgE/PrpD family protein n=1 Tax=Brucella tritici TaxID=94626 RepID=A0A7V7VXL5_9HYPH|nr:MULTISPECIES: MmgE/PrpD family protein [Brucella]KAB2658820.1 MmgE/PrpD family protein [Brucella tritici]KIU67544.1 MmgE/PrpD family protein [Brucella anthropi]UZD70663.1 MmgE/PrpD family protein [Brucella sp. JSBI001]